MPEFQIPGSPNHSRRREDPAIRFLKPILITLIVLIILVVAGYFIASSHYQQMLSPAGADNPVIVVIEPGEGAAAIGQTLQEKGIIRAAWAFRLAARLGKLESSLQAGEYELSPAMSVPLILGKLARGEVVLHPVTIPEGYTLVQIAELLENNRLCKSEEFLALARRPRSDVVPGVRLKNLEGYCFPDTYHFQAGVSAGQILDAMLEQFKEQVLPLYRLAVDRASTGNRLRTRTQAPTRLTLPQIITLASMVERETRVAAERPIVAAVYYNRLRLGMPMECDATVQYALGVQKPVLLYSDLEVDSPYNTYKYRGLPPGPIANPGLASIKAALSPARNNYLFYVLDETKNDGSHVFSRTFSAHQRAVRDTAPAPNL